MKRVLSLFDFTGQWSQPYVERGYEVWRVDIKHPAGQTIDRSEYGENVRLGCDVLHLPEDFIAMLAPCVGILAAPPCDEIAGSGAQYWPAKDADGRTDHAVALVRAPCCAS